jgi:hypothetical protein
MYQTKKQTAFFYFYPRSPSPINRTKFLRPHSCKKKDLSSDKLARPTWGPKLFWTEKEPNLELARKQHYGRDKDTGPTGRTPGFEPSGDIPDGEGRGANETDRAD